jgi:uncharacterized protein
MRPKKAVAASRPPDALATRLRLAGTYPDGGKLVPYSARRVPLGFGLMFGAGTLSGLLGIGSGAVKVLAMDEAMQIPFKVSTATSNFMIGVTAAASAGVYLSRGYINPAVAMPVTIGVLLGSLLGTKKKGSTIFMRLSKPLYSGRDQLCSLHWQRCLHSFL